MDDDSSFVDVVLLKMLSLFFIRVYARMQSSQTSNIHLRNTNYSYIEEQSEKQTEELRRKVKRLKNVVINIREEVRRQNDEMTKYQQLMSLTSNLVNKTHRHVLLVSKSSGWMIYVYLMLFSLFVFSIIYFLIR